MLFKKKTPQEICGIDGHSWTKSHHPLCPTPRNSPYGSPVCDVPVKVMFEGEERTAMLEVPKIIGPCRRCGVKPPTSPIKKGDV